LAIILVMAGLIASLQGLPGSDRLLAIAAVSDTTDVGVLDLLKTVDWRGRDAIMKSLEQAEPPRVALLLEVSRTHPKIATRRSAIRGLGRVGKDGICDTLNTMFGEGNDSVILDVMSDRDDCNAAYVSPFLMSTDPDARRCAFKAVSVFDRKAAISASFDGLGDAHHGVRHAVGSFLADEGAGALPILQDALGDRLDLRRATALRVLGRIGPEGLPLLESAVYTGDWRDRMTAVGALAQIPDSASKLVLETRLRVETHPRVVEALNEALSKRADDK
jgi:HEAT repeat protein